MSRSLPARLFLPAALLRAASASVGQNVLRPSRGAPPQPRAEREISRAAPVRRAPPVPAPAVPAATRIPVAPAVRVEKKATPRPAAKATPLPLPEMNDP